MTQPLPPFRSLLDIGAHVGSFTREVLRDRRLDACLMVEANEFCATHLEKVGVPYRIALLGEVTGAVALYWMTKKNLLNTGNSCYLEMTDFYDEEHRIPVPRMTWALDDIAKGQAFEFIKMDTQGSELDILRGGLQTLARAKHVLIECAVKPYNEGAPMKEDVVRFLAAQGFPCTRVLPVPAYQVAQEDILFSREAA